MKRVVIFLSIIIALLILKWLFFPGREKAGAMQNSAKGQPVGVSVYLVKNEAIAYTVRAAASIDARESVELSPEKGGRVRQVLFREGNKVNKGALLVKLNDDDLQAQLKRLELQLELSMQRLARLEKLLAVNGTSQEEFDQMSNNVAVLEADIELTKAEIAKTEIRAPFQGVLGLKNISEGAVIQAGIPIVSLVQQDELLLDFSIPERYYGQVNLDMPVQFQVEGQAGEFTARIIALEPRIEEGTRSLRIRASYPNSGAKLLPGMSAKVDLTLKSRPDALMIPTQAVIPILKGQKVFVVKEGKAREVQIHTGQREASRLEVLEGLQPGDSLVTTGIMSLREGTPVRVLKEKPAGEAVQP